MNIELLRSPWFLLAVVLIASGAFLTALLHLVPAGVVLLGLGVAAVAFAVYRHGGWNGRSRG
ncbi:hypothetical protein [Arthrobacter sp. JSM 101049]|uniref:hypothetical protein n=1 Tax=Arthrobacter sp. JSM 101049 TaxID=929097 RepID=UPI00356A7F68